MKISLFLFVIKILKWQIIIKYLCEKQNIIIIK